MAVFAAAGAIVLMMPVLQLLAQRALVASTVLVLPDAGFAGLKERFAAEEILLPSPEPETPAYSPSSGPESSEPLQENSSPPTNEPSASAKAPEIPAAYQGRLLQETILGDESNTFLSVGEGYLRNYTKLSFEEIAQIIESTPVFPLEADGDPEVLIVHTHATESYEMYDSPVYDTRNSWRSLDNNNNMVRVGSAMARVLEENGIGVIHDTTQHDYPSYNGSYDNSKATIQKWLAEYPSIKIVLDVHRDAIQRDESTVVKPTAVIDGKKAAQLMIIAGSDDGTMNMPNWRTNLAFAVKLQNQVEADWPALTRPIFFCYRKYNMDLTPGSLLLEMGSNGNTLEEAVYSGELIARSLADLITEMRG